MGRSRRVSLLTPAALLLGGLTAASFQGGASADAADDPIALSGPLPGKADTVHVLVLPPVESLKPGESAPQLELDKVDVKIDGGRYQAFIDPESVPDSYVGRAGVVDLVVYATTGPNVERGWETETSARITRFQGDAMSEAFWTDPIDTAAVVSAPGATARSAVVPSNYRTEVEDDGVFVENQYIPGRSYSGCQQSNTGEQSVRSTTIGTTYPFGNSTARMTVSSSQGANYGVAAAESGSSVGFTLAGSLYSRSAWGFDWTFDTRDRSYRKGIEYTKFAITCGVPGNSYTEYKWKPTGETGGVDQNFDIARPTWNNCAGIHAEGIWRRDSDSGYSYKYGAAVKFASVIGIDLSVDRQYSAAQKIEYNVVGLNKKMCGNNANPSIAGKVMMRRQ